MQITIKQSIHAPIDRVWQLWTEPEHIMAWNNASDDWHTPHATSDLRVGGRFVSTMAARDGSMSFDFEGQYTEVQAPTRLAYTIADGRAVQVDFEADGDVTYVTETFETENMNPEELQRAGWQAILDNFKRYAEGQ
jgi:uncharacterized protein YndB with AHSA1/START domain